MEGHEDPVDRVTGRYWTFLKVVTTNYETVEEGIRIMPRCKGCGKPIETNGKGNHECDNSDVVRIEIGEVNHYPNSKKERVKFKADTEWGYMHRECFLIAIGAPILKFAKAKTG